MKTNHMKSNESILVLGASANPNRSSYFATKYLHNKGVSQNAIANKKGKIDDLELSDQYASIDSVDTISIYLNADRQKKYYDYILSLHPKRIIFNPGTENPELVSIAKKHCIEIVTGCTIAMLAAGLLRIS